MKTSNNKRFSRKHDRKVLVAEESTKRWADSDSDSSSSSSSSSESEQEEVHCFMADQTDEDEVFDFSNVEFTRDDLVIALNDMVKEYRKLSHSFEEAKAENMSLKSSSAESSSDELEDVDILKTELSKLQAENEMLKNETSELKAEVDKLTVEMSSWNKANLSLYKLYESQKQVSDKTVIGFNNSEFCEGESSTQSRPAYDKFNKMSFVKADMMYNCLESVKYDNQNSPKLNENGKAGIGFSKPERFKPNWLKNRLDKDKAKASQKPFVPNQSWHNSKKVKSDWKKFQQRRDQYDQSMKPKLKRPARDFAHTFVDPRTGKTAGSFNAITVEKFSLMTAVVCMIKMNWAKFLFSILTKMVTPGSKQAKGFAIQISLLLATIPTLELGESSEFPASKILSKKTVHRFVSINDRDVDVPADKAQPVATEEKHWFDLPYEDLVAKWESERSVVTASDTDEEIATMDVAPADGDQQVQESVAPISNDDMLSADERMSMDDILLTIPVDIPLPSSSMEITKIMMGKSIKIPGVTKWTWFLKSLPRIPTDDKGKEILVEKDPVKGNPAEEHYSLICADIDLLVDLRAKVIDEVAQFLNSFSLKKLATINFEEMYKKEEQVLYWGETESPQGSPRDRGAIIARNNTHTPSRCWIRTMLYVNGEWIVEPCADRWVKIPQLAISTEVPHQRQYDDTLPTMSVFFRLMTKRWADVCIAVAESCASQRLLPVGSLQFCRSLQLVEPVSRIASSRSPVFAFRVSQFCSIFVDFSLFNWIPSADILEFLSSVALDRTVLRSVQIAQSVVPSVQLSLDQHQSSPTTADSSSSLHFDKTDVDATASPLPHVSQDLSAALADLQANLSEQIFEYQSDLSSKLHKIEQSVCDSLRDQADIFRNLSQGARQEVRTLDDVHTIRFNEFRKNVLAQNASIFTGLADVRQEVQAVNAKVDIMASRLNAIQKDAEATKEALSHQLLEFQSQAQENHNVIHAQLSELVDYIHRGSADKKGESGSRGLQQPANIQIEGSAVTPTFEQRVEMAQRRIVHTVLDADANRALFARQDAADRDRERRRREARALKRSRRD
ncbi:hypothetical protein F511_41489 [Dorcoceras hygrometricum]|uniref:Uncharacterized protein n=1 Tax=Dorcoceras hygrometricum TaxID=472368 RepID=A0A2Z7AUD9_9LAMI|nr:hypothetical protein F511_41489 [Dorcoceras hygrometricum]